MKAKIILLFFILVGLVGVFATELHDVALVDFQYSGKDSINKIWVQKWEAGFLNETFIDENESLECQEKYLVRIGVKNQGDYFENATFNGSIGGVNFNHFPIMNFAPGDEVIGKLIILRSGDIETGFYNMTIESIIGQDDVPENNIARREFFVDCGPICDDSDGDGVCDEDDMCDETPSGEEVDLMGCDPWQFCAKAQCGLDCFELDWKNDEEERFPGDCTVAIPLKNGIEQQPVCVPTIKEDVCQVPR